MKKILNHHIINNSMRKSIKHTDKQISELAKKESSPGNPEFCQQLVQQALELVRQSADRPQTASRTYIRYVTAVSAAALLAVYPVKAATDYVTTRLAGMSEKEKDDLRTMVYKDEMSGTREEREAIRYSRDFTGREQKQYEIIQDQYESGIFPKGAVTICGNLSDADKDMVCYIPKDRYLYLPDRTLTDEELLQITDFYHKTDYSLYTGDTTTDYKKEMDQKADNAAPEKGSLSRDRAASAASACMKAMYGLSTNGMSRKITLDKKKDYLVTFVSDSAVYTVGIQADNGRFLHISMEQEGFVFYQDNLQAGQNKIRRQGKKAKTIAKQLAGPDAIITDSCASYKVNENGQIPHGSILYLFELEDGDRIRMSFSLAEDTLWGASLEPGGAGHKDTDVRPVETRIFLNTD